MPKPSSVEAALDRLVALRADPSAPNAVEELVRGLGHRSDIVVAKAVQLTGEFRLRQLKPRLVEAYTRFLSTLDRGCEIKIAIVRILFDLEMNDPDVVEQVYLPGLRVYQLEWGKDVAAELRGYCAMGLAAAGHRDIMVVLADMLTDEWPAARAGAARALGFTGQDSAALLLRLKLKLTGGDPDPDVAEECMNTLVKLWPERSIEFIASFLDHRDDAMRSAAALALGASRQPAALERLRICLERGADADTRKIVLLAIATLRLPQAVDCVLAAAGSRDTATTIAAIEALGLYRNDESVRAKLKTAIAGRGDDIQRAYAKAFGKGGMS